ncbi:hypothetical protein C2W62_37100 [Candidatus Entotheonella serta]|nr:hypothetical protein C2W62_37100 [Candidatus Entotheonella serta]
MKTTREFLADLIQQNIRLWADGDQLRLRVPEGGVTDDLIQQLQARKAEILDFLRRSAHKVDRLPIESMPRQEPLPLSYAQQRLWFLDQLEGPSSTYNIPWALRLSGALQIAALEQALNVIVQRHDVLRTTFCARRSLPKRASLYKASHLICACLSRWSTSNIWPRRHSWLNSIVCWIKKQSAPSIWLGGHCCVRPYT